MVCTANDLLGWSDFPKGLRVLLLDEDSSFSNEIKSKLEKMDYIGLFNNHQVLRLGCQKKDGQWYCGKEESFMLLSFWTNIYLKTFSSFCNVNEALSAISNKSLSFHVAIIEVSTENSDGRFKFLEAAKDLPTIMTSNMQCLSTMMKCIALGAVEFLPKPLSDDKLKNLWQHVVHKAFNAGGKKFPESLDPINGSVFPKFDSQPEGEEKKSYLSVKTEENNQETSYTSDKCQTPPTPQLKQGARLVDDVDCQDQTNCSSERENGDQDEESKFVETTSPDIVDEVTKEVEHCPTISKSKSYTFSQPKDKIVPSGKKANRKKIKVDWTPNLHKKFLHAVEQLGVDQAIPSRILEIMKVEGLTRHNIASHLQKYRMHHRPILPKQDDQRWSQQRDLYQRSYYPHGSMMAYPMSGPHGCYPLGQMWAPTYYLPLQPNESWHWQTYPGMHANTWGCPVMPPPQGSCQPPPQNVDGFHNSQVVHDSYSVSQESFERYPGEEEIDRAVKEAISKPWLPLPIGLKPPSTDSVLAEHSKLHWYHVSNSSFPLQ